VDVPEDAAAFVAEVTADKSEPLVMFALEWCEFCWSVRKMLKALDIPYRSIDLDSVAYQEDNKGGKIRAALKAITDYDTIPQIFVGGEFIGGCTEFFDAYREGRIQAMLKASGRDIGDEALVDPYTFLPTWLHPR
jgi:cysteine synthase A